MQKFLAPALIALSLSISGAAFAQSQNSTDAGKHTDPDASTDVRETPIPPQQAAPAAQSTDAGKRNDPDAASDAREQAMKPRPPEQAAAPANSTDAGKRNDPDAASDAQEGSPAH
jgi:hypothetical protein